MDERNLINGSLVSYLSWAADFISPIRWFLLAHSHWFWPTWNSVSKQHGIGAKPYAKAGRYAEAQTKSSTIFAGYWSPRALAKHRHTVRDSHITGTCAVSGVWLWNQFVFQQLLRSPGKQTANQYLQMVKKQVRYYGSPPTMKTIPRKHKLYIG